MFNSGCLTSVTVFQTQCDLPANHHFIVANAMPEQASSDKTEKLMRSENIFIIRTSFEMIPNGVPLDTALQSFLIKVRAPVTTHLALCLHF
jgi:hypothetical protein